MKKFLMISMILIINGCGDTPPEPKAFKPQNKIYRDATTVNRASCLDVGTDSLTCKTRRISYKLDLLELNINNVISGVGDCESCGS